MEELSRSRDKQRFARGAAELALKEIGEQLFDAEDELKKARLELDRMKGGLVRELNGKSQACRYFNIYSLPNLISKYIGSSTSAKCYQVTESPSREAGSRSVSRSLHLEGTRSEGS